MLISIGTQSNKLFYGKTRRQRSRLTVDTGCSLPDPDVYSPEQSKTAKAFVPTSEDGVLSVGSPGSPKCERPPAPALLTPDIGQELLEWILPALTHSKGREDSGPACAGASPAGLRGELDGPAAGCDHVSQNPGLQFLVTGAPSRRRRQRVSSPLTKPSARDTEKQTPHPVSTRGTHRSLGMRPSSPASTAGWWVRWLRSPHGNSSL